MTINVIAECNHSVVLCVVGDENGQREASDTRA